MKKGLILCIILVLTILLTGCGNKKKQVTCTRENEYSAAGVKTASLIADLDSNNKVTGITVVQYMESVEKAKSYVDSISNNNGAITQEGNKIIIKNVTITGISTEKGKESTKDEFISSLESINYTCK